MGRPAVAAIIDATSRPATIAAGAMEHVLPRAVL